MRYSILGFRQKKVCALTKKVQLEDNKVKVYRLDMTDLIILQDIADFMNRKSIIKYTVDGKMYFSITHNAILKDLPILDIKKQALKDRIDKMCLLGVIEKHISRSDNGTWVGYCLTDIYESLTYSDEEEEGVYQTTRGGCSGLHEGGVVDYNPYNSTTIKQTTNKKEKEDNISSKKKQERLDVLVRFDLSNLPQEYVETIREWCVYKKEKGQTYKTQSSFETMAKRLIRLSGGSPSKAHEIVEQSIANNYAGLFEIKTTHADPLGFKLQDDRRKVMSELPKQSW